MIPIAQIDEYIRKELKSQKIPGLSVGIIENGKLIYGQGYGYSNIEHQVPVKLETIFQSGSMGKQFTALAIMILVEREEIDLDTSINEYIDDLPKKWNNITVQHLLTHTSGLGDYPDEVDMTQEITEEEMFEIVKRSPLAFKPGEQYSYSNLGYMTLGVLIRAVTGEFYGDFLRTNVFEPLGMKTARIISESDIVSNRAAGYTLVDGQIKNQEWVAPSFNQFADGALYLSMNDMINYEKAFNTNQILKNRNSFDEMWSPFKLNDGSISTYGFGWNLDKTLNGMRVVYHGGTWQGFQSFIIRILTAKLTVVIFSNIYESDVEKIAYHILELCNPQFALQSNQEEAQEEDE